MSSCFAFKRFFCFPTKCIISWNLLLILCRQCLNKFFLRWRDDTGRQQLPHYSDFIRHTTAPLLCCVLSISPALLLPWRYTDEQSRSFRSWNCTAVWLHAANLPNGEIYRADLCLDLQEALNILAANKESARYSLLVDRSGMSYDSNRIGGDCQVKLENGRMFTFSVRKHVDSDHLLLLAVAWN
jgi:hypothetical protein